MIGGARIKRTDGTWTDKGGGGEQWVEPPPGMKPSAGVSLFQGWDWLTTAPLLDTGDVTDMTYMFLGCTSLTEIPLLDTSNVTNMTGMFASCTSLTEIPLLDTSNVTNMTYMFNGCTSLTEIPLLDTSDATNMTGMFNGCTSLTEIPLLDTSNATNMTGMFNDCTSLAAIELDMSSITSFTTVWGATESSALSSLTSLLTHGLKRSLSVRWTAMEASALNAWFDSLGQAATNATITITGAPGADTCDRTIATNKGWTVVD